MGLFDQKHIALCVKGQGVIEMFDILKFALLAKEKMQKDDYLNADKIYVKDFETGQAY